MACPTHAAATLGLLLSTNFEIAELVLQPLPVVELCRLQRVCRLWQSVAAKELSRRYQVQFFTTADRDKSLEWRDVPGLEKRRFVQWRQHWQSKPSLCLQFCELAPRKNLGSTGGFSMEHNLPPTCAILSVPCCAGIVGTQQVRPYCQSSLEGSVSICKTNHCPNASTPAISALPLPLLRGPCSKNMDHWNNGGSCSDEATTSQSTSATPKTSPSKTSSSCIEAKKFFMDPKSSEGGPEEAPVPTKRQRQSSHHHTAKKRKHSVFAVPLGPNVLSPEHERRLLEHAINRCERCKEGVKSNTGPISLCFRKKILQGKKVATDRVAVLCLPEMRNVHFQVLRSKGSQHHAPGAPPWHAEVRQRQDLQALLVFSDTWTEVEAGLRAVVIRRCGRVAVAGGFVSSYNRGHAEQVWGLAVSGPGVAAATILLDSTTSTLPAISAALKQVQHLYDRRRQSVAFFVSCVARKTLKEEVEVFRTLYPTTPVLGCYVFGELCHEFVPPRPESEKQQQKMQPQPQQQQQQQQQQEVEEEEQQQDYVLDDGVQRQRVNVNYQFSTVVLFLQFT